MKKNARRKFIFCGLGAFVASAVAAWFQKNRILRWVAGRHRNPNLKLTAAPLEGEDICILSSRQAEGPFFVSAPQRRDIKEDRTGKALQLKLQVLRMPDCKPINGALVEIWHCDAEGAYSGYPEEIAHDPWKGFLFLGSTSGTHVNPINEKRFLRGAQVTDASGHVEFETIFPGWYEPRAPHIHVKIIADDKECLTTALYFETDFCNRLYLQQTPYNKRGESPYHPLNDIAMEDSQEAVGLLLKPSWSDGGPIKASIRIGVQRIA
jgi:protocatechuate 3,4-dioxygenase beta subunit